ncbi:unnamed protein product [Brassica oleracea]
MTRSHCYCFSGIIISLLIHTLASPPLHFCLPDQRDALLEFKDEFPIDESNPIAWNNTSTDCCFWKGITCNDRSGQVISLNLFDTFLNGSLKTNSSLFRLQYLRHLNLSYSYLQGEIPSSIGNLSYLFYLQLSTNNLVGQVPSSIGNLNKLQVMSLGQNNLNGTIPIPFTNLTKLYHISLRSNNFTSTLPSDMSGFHSLKHFDVSNNSFLGPFPKSLFSIPYKQFLWKKTNSLDL